MVVEKFKTPHIKTKSLNFSTPTDILCLWLYKLIFYPLNGGNTNTL